MKPFKFRLVSFSRKKRDMGHHSYVRLEAAKIISVVSV